eukprot:CAMPEP_0118950498 /NCGR_PEP_ID=MMETSP1169-20130426/51477_1 /TAXON_ID=36882 /ORGANISM="Pyramimonas obovata, Strain CCMP722" /LENGTH=234 /DNA_ID=CAMNT_0006897349 /DNA_START=218 /DNA_END=919 /DNA_ORIENTATION=+
MPTAVVFESIDESLAEIAIDSLERFWQGVWEASPWEPSAVLSRPDETTPIGSSVQIVAKLGAPPAEILKATRAAIRDNAALRNRASSGMDEDIGCLLESTADYLSKLVGTSMGAHVILVTSKANAKFPISQKIYSALAPPWQCFHVFCLAPSPPPGASAAAARRDSWRRLVTATNGNHCRLAADVDASDRNRTIDQLLAAHFPPYKAALHCGHLAGEIALSPNPRLNPLLPHLR